MVLRWIVEKTRGSVGATGGQEPAVTVLKIWQIGRHEALGVL